MNIENTSKASYYIHAMNVEYESDKIRNILEDFPTLQRKCSKHALQIKRRMQQLKSFVSLYEFMNSGFDNPHFEKGDMAGLIGWDVNQNVRFLFSVDENMDANFRSQMKDIKNIKVIGVLDYHGGKKNWIIG